MPCDQTINASTYCETLKRLQKAIHNHRRVLVSDVWEHLVYRICIAPGDYHIFTKSKEFLEKITLLAENTEDLM
ncbi:hypothetical protein PR048_026266 [Dryococelus australis]|uniref:Uncharacterized protein n=1 Tax=Dryococelus australis TaxID=614101 RepID=A0ABQ9GKV5_9NEOP|nr:hypothetical protein PR048_026266 [Dryococelus australis]